MKLQTVALALLCSSISSTFAQSCTDGLYIIVARGSLEPQGQGKMKPVAHKVKRHVPNSKAVGLRYPAEVDHYSNSVAKGVINLTQMIEGYVNTCPGANIVLMGYSQGAHVVGDTLCGASEKGFNSSVPLPKEYAKHISAVVQMGDPTFVAGLPYDVGTAKKNGKFPRQNPAPCLRYKKRLRSYCDKNDLYCSSGKSAKVHASYVKKDGHAAANFVVETYRRELRHKAAANAPDGNSPAGGNGGANPNTNNAAQKAKRLPSSAALYPFLLSWFM